MGTQRNVIAQINWAAFIALGLLVVTASDAAAQAPTVKQVFEKYDLIGVFGVDCSKPASKQNLYHVHRVVDDGHVQADQMSSATDRDFMMMIDQIVDTKPNAVTVSGTIDNQRYRLTLSLDGKRKRTMEMVREPNQTVIKDGKRVNRNEELPWHTKCS